MGFNFYQVSYRAAVRYRNARGRWRRGGYFVRSETNDALMRRIGNALAEFKFHEFGEADMVMAREGDQLTFAVDPLPDFPGGRLVGVLDTRPLPGPPPGSVWPNLEELHEPLVECYDAFGVADGYMYVLTIDRGPWNAQFVKPVELYCEAMQDGHVRGPFPAGLGAAPARLRLPLAQAEARAHSRRGVSVRPAACPAPAVEHGTRASVTLTV